MKLEYLDDVSDGGKYPWADPNQLVRLYDFNHSEVEEFRQAIQRMLLDSIKELDVSSLSIVQSVNCKLILRSSPTDKGITTKDKYAFYCDLTEDTYKQMLALLEPFCQFDATGYQWLYDLNNPIDFLISKDGSW